MVFWFWIIDSCFVCKYKDVIFCFFFVIIHFFNCILLSFDSTRHKKGNAALNDIGSSHSSPQRPSTSPAGQNHRLKFWQETNKRSSSVPLTIIVTAFSYAWHCSQDYGWESCLACVGRILIFRWDFCTSAEHSTVSTKKNALQRPGKIQRKSWCKRQNPKTRAAVYLCFPWPHKISS